MIYILPDQKNPVRLKTVAIPLQSAHPCLQVIAEQNCQCGSRTAPQTLTFPRKSHYLSGWMCIAFRSNISENGLSPVITSLPNKTSIQSCLECQETEHTLNLLKYLPEVLSFNCKTHITSDQDSKHVNNQLRDWRGTENESIVCLTSEGGLGILSTVERVCVSCGQDGVN